MKNIALLCIITLAFVSCKDAQTQQINKNNINTTQLDSKPDQREGTGFSGGDQGNPKFRTTGIKYYVGCWQPEKNFKPRFEPKFDVFYITEENIRTSKMSEPISYEEINEGKNKEYFVLHLKSEDKSSQLTPYIYIFMALDTEMDLSTLEKFATETDIKRQSKNQWRLTKVDCEQVHNKFEKE